MSSDAPTLAPTAPSDPVLAPANAAPIAVRIDNAGKCYEIYDRPHDRLKQALFGRDSRHFFREFWALAGVNLTVHQGETLGIIGKNGSGKSTLLQMICGTLAPTLGSIETHGRVAALLELGAGFHPEFSGRENVYLNARILGLSKEQTDGRFDRIAAFADIGAFIDQPVKTYSSGMYVRLAFSVIANVDADILVIDEALAVGDAFFTQKCMRFLRTFREKGTIIFVSHDAAAVLSLCERALWLDGGRVRQIGPAKSVNESYLAELFGEINRQRAGDTAPAPIASPETPLPPIESLPVRPVQTTSESFGEGGAIILGVDILDEHAGAPHITQLAEPGHMVTVRIHFRAVQTLARPLVGFYIKDRLGQNLFGQNTGFQYGSAPPPMSAGEQRVAQFSFEMPVLQSGHYTLTVAVADGTAHTHVQHHWIHDAYVITAAGTDAVATGLVGLPMKKVEYRNLPESAHGHA